MKVLDVVLLAKSAAQNAYVENRSTPNRRDYYAVVKAAPTLRPSVSRYVSELYTETFKAEIRRLS